MTKFSLFERWLLSLFLVWVSGSLVWSQSNLILQKSQDTSSHSECLYQKYQDELNTYFQNKLNIQRKYFATRSNNGKFELRIYVDTSYERRRTGVYNRNDSVISYLNKLVDSVEWLFNVSAPYWDVDIETDILFFDTLTPFSYGANASETLINFYDWVDSQGYPGNDDNYVFYSGNYTNQGISFVGELCTPGGSMMGYVNSFIPNVDLSSHEWMGHAANSLHYNTEVNIMNSFASRPWNTPSLIVIQNFLDNQSCVVNVQPPLAISFESFTANLIENKVMLNWNFDPTAEVDFFSIQRKYQNEEWEETGVEKENQYYIDRLEKQGPCYYRIQANLSNRKHILSDIKFIHFSESESISINDSRIINPEGKLVCIFDFLGRQILQSSDNNIDLKSISTFQNILILYNQKLIKWTFYK